MYLIDVNSQKKSKCICTGMAQWIVCLTRSSPIKGPVVSLSKKLYSHCLVLVGTRNRFERDLHKQKVLVSQSD